MCSDCNHTGYLWRDACADGMCSDAIQILTRCACNPEPTDDDAHGFDDFGYPGETEYPADFDVPGVDYDRTIDGTLPSHLLA